MNKRKISNEFYQGGNHTAGVFQRITELENKIAIIFQVLIHFHPLASPRSNAKTYITSGCQCLENLNQFKANTERSS